MISIMAHNMESINTSFITLVPKINNPITINDYMPISLLNSILKLLTKILAERLQTIIFQLLYANQYGFIKTRTIHGCLAWSFEYIHQCHQSKKQIIIIKLDFTKAFDTVEHTAMLQVMQHMGFPERWVDWIKMILSTGTSLVLFNGVPNKHFVLKRGVRQGDPLSPLLFVLAAELLQYVINDACRNGMLPIPIPQPTSDFPIVSTRMTHFYSCKLMLLS